jgi:hypothetical protein
VRCGRPGRDRLARGDLFAGSVLSAREREAVFDGFLRRCRWVEVFYAWRPNPPDDADNHLIDALKLLDRLEAVLPDAALFPR